MSRGADVWLRYWTRGDEIIVIGRLNGKYRLLDERKRSFVIPLETLLHYTPGNGWGQPIDNQEAQIDRFFMALHLGFA